MLSYKYTYLKLIFNSSLFRASGVYVISTILNSAIPFFLLPILTRYLTPEDYGIVSMYSILVSVYNVFIGLSIHGAINRAYFEKNINFRVYVFNCLIILLLSTLITFTFSLLFLDSIYKTTIVPKKWILIAIVMSSFQFIILFYCLYIKQGC